MTFEKRLEAFNDLCNERAKILVENKEVIAQYEKYQKSIQDINEKYSEIIDSVSPEYLEKLVNEKIQSMKKAGKKPICYGYVSKDRKEEILKLVANGRNEVSYRELQDYIRSKGVAATAGSFFRDQVKRYKKVGGNKNKRLILTR